MRLKQFQDAKEPTPLLLQTGKMGGCVVAGGHTDLRAGSAVKGSLAVGLNLGRDARAAAAAATAPWGRGLTGARGLRSMLVARSAVCANALAAWKLSRLPTTAGRAFGGLRGSDGKALNHQSKLLILPTACLRSFVLGVVHTEGHGSL